MTDAEMENGSRQSKTNPRSVLRLPRWRYFFGGAALVARAAAAAGAAAGAAPGAPSAGAPSAPSAALSAFFAFFQTIFCTRTLGNPNGLRPSGHFSASCSFLIRSARVNTLRLAEPADRRFRDLSMDILGQESGVSGQSMISAKSDSMPHRDARQPKD